MKKIIFLFFTLNILVISFVQKVKSNEFKVCREKAIKLIDQISWNNGFYRKDIGYKVIDE